jgi:hypothetical protein
VLIAAAHGGAVAARTTGATVSYTETDPATTTLTVQRPAPGRRNHGSCVRPTRRNRTHRRCTRWVKVGHFTHHDGAGPNELHFTGRVGGHKLRAGKYRLQAIPRNSAGAGAAVNSGFQSQAALNLSARWRLRPPHGRSCQTAVRPPLAAVG